MSGTPITSPGPSGATSTSQPGTTNCGAVSIPCTAKPEGPPGHDERGSVPDPVPGEAGGPGPPGGGVAAVNAAVLGQVTERIEVRAARGRGRHDVRAPAQPADRHRVGHEELPEVAAGED